MTTLASLNMSTLAKGDTFTDPTTGIAYVMQSTRATRRGCKFCGQGSTTEDREGDRGVWWAQPSDSVGEHHWTLVNRDGSSHHNTCPKAPKSKGDQVSMASDQALAALKSGEVAPWIDEAVPTPELEEDVPVVYVSHEAAIENWTVRQYVREHQKIKAIKEYRILTGQSLIDSKLAIDKLEQEMSAPTPNVAPMPELASDDAAKVKALMELLLKPSVTPEQVKTMVDYAMDQFKGELLESVGGIISDAKATLTAPLVVKFEQPNQAEPVTIENAHADLPDIVAALRAGRNIFMVGMAGTGKTTLAAHAAEACGLPFYDISMSPDAGRHLLMGYQTADGTFIPPSLYRAVKDGGLFHFDECDNSNPGLITVVNQILSNGHVRFADGELVTKHPNFRAMASGNTYGNGATAMYVGRQPLDGAFKNRWIMVTVKVDESVEYAMCAATGATANTVTKVLRYVRALRNSATEQNLEMLFTPRNSENLCCLLSIGWSVDKAVEAAVRMGASDTDWRKVHKTDQGYDKIQPFSI